MSKVSDFFRKSFWQNPEYDMHQKPCPEVTTPMEPALYQKLLSMAREAGVQIVGNKATFRGCDFDWNYDTAEGIFHYTCTNRRFYISCELLQAEMAKLIEQARTGI